jgi:hypothetical protein
VRGGRGGKGDEANDVYKLVRMCKDKKFFPVIVFSFSRRETEANCSMCSKLAFNNEEEAAQVQAVCASPSLKTNHASSAPRCRRLPLSPLFANCCNQPDQLSRLADL